MPFNRMPTSGQISSFPAGTFNTLVGIAERNERERSRFGRTASRDILPPSYTWRNDAGSDAPDGAIVRITGAVDIDNTVCLKGAQPNTSLHLNYAISLGPCAAGALAECTLFDPARAVYESSDGTPAFGETWGFEPSDWKLRKGRYGFEIQGFPDSGKVLACPIPIRTIQGKLAEQLDAASGDTPESGTLTLWYFNGTAFVASTITATIWNTTGSDLPASKLMTAQLVDGIWLADVGGGEGSRRFKGTLGSALSVAGITAFDGGSVPDEEGVTLSNPLNYPTDSGVLVFFEENLAEDPVTYEIYAIYHTTLDHVITDVVHGSLDLRQSTQVIHVPISGAAGDEQITPYTHCTNPEE